MQIDDSLLKKISELQSMSATYHNDIDIIEGALTLLVNTDPELQLNVKHVNSNIVKEGIFSTDFKICNYAISDIILNIKMDATNQLSYHHFNDFYPDISEYRISNLIKTSVFSITSDSNLSWQVGRHNNSSKKIHALTLVSEAIEHILHMLDEWRQYINTDILLRSNNRGTNCKIETLEAFIRLPFSYTNYMSSRSHLDWHLDHLR